MGKHIEDIHSFSPLCPSQRSWREAPLLSLLAGMGACFSCRINQLSAQERGQQQNVEIFHPVLFCGCEHVLVLVLELSTLLAQAGEIPLAEPEMTLDGFSREWVVLISPGKDREAWINHVHPPWQPCWGHWVYARTEISAISVNCGWHG